MISPDAPFYFEEGSKVRFTTNIQVSYKYDPIQETALCELIAYSAGADIEQSGSYLMTLTKAQIDAETGSGTNPSDKMLDQVELAVIDYLEGISENSGIVFTN